LIALFVHSVIFMGVRDGESGGSAAPPGLKIFRANSVFRASASCSKILSDKKCIFNKVKNFRATLFFRASASCSKILNNKNIYIQDCEFKANSVFHGKRKLPKTPECKKYIQYSENFQGKLCFQGMRKLLKILNVKCIFNTVKIFRATLVFQGKRKSLKNL